MEENGGSDRYSERIGEDIPYTMQYLLGGKASSKVTARMMDASEITF